MSGFNIPKYQLYESTHNYSNLFTAMNKASGGNTSLYSSLGDLSAIRNGSYKRLAIKHFANLDSSDASAAKKLQTKKKEDPEKTEFQEKLEKITGDAKKTSKVLKTYTPDAKATEINMNSLSNAFDFEV